MPVPRPGTGTPECATHACLRSNRKYARPLVRTSPAESRARLLASGRSGTAPKGATVRYQKPCAGASPEGRDEDKQNAKRGSPPTHQAPRLPALGAGRAARGDERRSTGCALRRRWRVSTRGGEASSGTPGTGEHICPACAGTGRLGRTDVRYCGGIGRITDVLEP